MTAPEGTPPLYWLLAVVIVAAIPAVCVLIPTLLNARRTRTVLDHVQNSHSSNLRDDLDAKFAEMNAGVEHARNEIRSVREDVQLVRDEARDDRHEARETRRQIGEVDRKLTSHLREADS